VTIDRDALGHSVAWAVLAMTGWWLDGWTAGLLLLFGPTMPIMAVTYWYLIRQGDIAKVRAARWVVLAAAAVTYGLWKLSV
jgi:hypothetical protein